jgi:molecular chaperone GrpE
MNDKENKAGEESGETESNGGEAVQAFTANAQAPSDFEGLKKQLDEAAAKAAENLDGWQRAVAEFQNYRKRTERDNENLHTGMKGDILRKILPVLDDLERALQNRPTDSGPWVSGIELIQKKLSTLLEAEGLQRIEAVGQPFDPNFHEAISHEPSENVESGHVISVTQNGYMLGERVIRPATVRVAK